MSKIKKDLRELKGRFDTIIFGSYLEDAMRPSSDIDIGIITYKSKMNENIEIQKELLGKFPLIYDIRVFELFPIDIKIQIIKNYEVLFGDILEISEYFYIFRKKWDDIKYRILENQFSSFQERLSLMKKYSKSE
ncbi:MAG: hypothetical protein BAJALOKI3v1_760004 [Promethearchaeota archaeon]|nr:MAG: hypothetical protein BAJALOKI3v1_760004 [Candidatus Lokiarchaeota archaeon]